MTDLHTHILPGMDDGAQSMEEALMLLRMQAQQGVDTVALTPHFYKRRENATDFLARRKAAWIRLQEATQNDDYPKLILGAEVAWMSEMTQWPELEALCYQGTKTLLVELPTMPWTDSVFRELYSLEGRRGIMPMIAHVDRYFYFQKEKSIERLLEMGYPVQVSAEALFRLFTRKKALNLLENYEGLLISDCHNLTDRKPNIEAAMKIVEKKLGHRTAREIAGVTDEVLIV